MAGGNTIGAQFGDQTGKGFGGPPNLRRRGDPDRTHIGNVQHFFDIPSRLSGDAIRLWQAPLADSMGAGGLSATYCSI
jgi:hypothetical protein